MQTGLTQPLSFSDTTALVKPKAKDDPKKVADAAKQFESLLISQVLKIARESTGDGWLGTGEDDAAESAMDLGQDYFARTIAQQGGFGLARMIMQGLTQNSSTGSNPTTDATAKDPATQTLKPLER